MTEGGTQPPEAERRWVYGAGDSEGPPLLSLRESYLLALGLLLLSLVGFAIADDRPAARTVVVALQGVTLLVILWSSHARRAHLVAATALVLFSVGSSAAAAVTGHIDRLGTPFAMTAVLAIAAPIAIVRRLLREKRIEPSTVFGALCIYLLAGLLFASMYGAIQEFSDVGFFAQVDRGEAIDFVYFSFVTLATLGYGDLTPITDLGRMLAITQTMLGQLYLVAVVAVLVSNLGKVRVRRDTSSAEGDRT